MTDRDIPARLAAMLALAAALASGAVSAAGDRLVAQRPLFGEFTAVIAEGDLEPRWDGSYAVRIYEPLDKGRLVAGVVRARNGYIDNIEIQPHGARSADIVINLKGGEKGNVLGSDVFTFDGKVLRFDAKRSKPIR